MVRKKQGKCLSKFFAFCFKEINKKCVIFRKALSMGSSEHWSEVLYVITGEREIKADALLEYYAPLDTFLENLILKYNIPYGWMEPIISKT